MKIRSITAFLVHPTIEEIAEAVFPCLALKSAIQNAGWEVQSIRLATSPFPLWIPPDGNPSPFIRELEDAAIQSGFDYLSIGSIPVQDLTYIAWVAEILAVTERTFCTTHLVRDRYHISNEAIAMTARLILENSRTDPLGFTNLRFSALANVPAGCPFFPAAYADATHHGIALAVEGADLAVDVFSNATSARQAAQELSTRITDAAIQLEFISKKSAGTAFSGIDFTLAPFPEQSRSIGTALERLGIPAFGQSGSLAASAFLMGILDQCRFQKAGFNGLMLPILEDFTLAGRNEEGFLSISQLLSYSAVCGTGLDCIPLPGDVSEDAIEAILLDLAALSCRLQKPLTARLMPVPGKKAGEITNFDFDFFANSRIMEPGGTGVGGILKASDEIAIFPRQS